MDLKRITLFDQSLFKHYLDINRFQNSDYSFATLFAWQPVFYTIIEGCLCVCSLTRDKQSFYCPLGEKSNIEKAIRSLMTIGPLSLILLSDEMIDMIREFGLYESFTVTPMPDDYDYIYTRES